MSIKLIACDMDGTLLNSERHISQRNKEAIKAVLDAGKMFIIATGRMFIAARPYVEELGLDIPMVTYNGGLIRNSVSGKILLEQPIKLETAQELLDYIRITGNYANFYVGDTLYIKEHNAYSKAYGDMQGIHSCIKAIGEAFYTAQGRPYKILLMMEEEEMPETMPKFKEKFAGKLHITSSHPQFLELMEPGVNKWQAIMKLAEQYGISQKEIMCLGDSGNDLEMIANAGIGVAMGNAVPSVKAAAKLVVPTNDENGVAYALEKLLKEENI